MYGEYQFLGVLGINSRNRKSRTSSNFLGVQPNLLRPLVSQRFPRPLVRNYRVISSRNHQCADLILETPSSSRSFLDSQGTVVKYIFKTRNWPRSAQLSAPVPPLSAPITI